MLGWRLAASLALSTIGGVGLWSVVVALPVIEAEFGVGRGGASLPYTATMVGFAAGSVLMGRLADRFGIMVPVMLGALMLGIGYVAAAQATSLWQFMLAQALLIGMLGSSITFGPLVADVSLWFQRRRGIAVAIVASGNYLAGTIWPPVLQSAIAAFGWRRAHVGIGVFCVLTMLPLALALAGGRRRTRGWPRPRPRLSRPGQRVAVGAPGAPGARRARLLHRHVDAAGAHRRLLRRPRLRAGARRRDALADAGHGRRQPARLGPDRRSDRRRRAPCCWAPPCSAWRSSSTCPSTG